LESQKYRRWAATVTCRYRGAAYDAVLSNGPLRCEEIVSRPPGGWPQQAPQDGRKKNGGAEAPPPDLDA